MTAVVRSTISVNDVDVLWAITGKAFKLGQTAASDHLTSDPQTRLIYSLIW